MENKHRWQEVTNSPQAYPAFRAKCVRCGEPLHSDRNAPSMWADLNGPAFVYHCGTCVNQIEILEGRIKL